MCIQNLYSPSKCIVNILIIICIKLPSAEAVCWCYLHTGQKWICKFINLFIKQHCTRTLCCSGAESAAVWERETCPVGWIYQLWDHAATGREKGVVLYFQMRGCSFEASGSKILYYCSRKETQLYGLLMTRGGRCHHRLLKLANGSYSELLITVLLSEMTGKLNLNETQAVVNYNILVRVVLLKKWPPPPTHTLHKLAMNRLHMDI